MDFSLPLLFVFMAVAIAALVWGAERFVHGAAGIAGNLGLSPLLIGLTVLSFGTSAPEILVSASAALAGSPTIAVGNALGSNLANMGLVLGCTALILPLAFSGRTARVELPIMLAVTGLAGAVLYDNYLGRGESWGLVVLLGGYLVYLWRSAGGGEALPVAHALPWGRAAGLTLVGLAVLLVGAQVTVWSATEVAAAFGVSEMVIGITVVAVGTSLPELAASMAGAMKGQPEMALGNVIGSNIFNLTAVLPVAGIIYPAAIYPAASAGGDFWRDFGAVLALCLVLSAVCLWKLGRGRRRLGRVTAVGLLGLYVGYYFLLLG